MENKKWYEGMHMLNRDPDWDIKWKKYGDDDSSRESCIKIIEQIFGEYAHPLTDVALCLFAQSALLPAKSYSWGGEKWIKYKDTDPERAARWRRAYLMFEEYKIDPVQMFIDITTKNGIRPWASFRMNDCHPPKPGKGSDMYEACLARGEMVGDAYGYFRHCFDFAYPTYRNALLGLLKEVFDKYDFYGFELDFLREPYCYDYKNNPDCHKMMTAYLREVKAILLEAEKRLGHEIKILIRVPSTPESAMQFGFDVKTLVNEGLVDAVQPGPRWRNCDSGIPVKAWQELVEHKVPIIPNIEALNLKYTRTDYTKAKGYLASFHAQGADGTYLYNFFSSKETGIWDITKDNCNEGERSFIVADQDIFAYPETRYLPLPLNVDGEATLPIEPGLIRPTDKVRVIIDFDGDEIPEISLFGKSYTAEKIEPVIRAACGKPEPANLTPHIPLAFDVSGIETASHLDLKFIGSGTVHYVEVAIDAK